MRLTEIDLTKGDDRVHPDIDLESEYLALLTGCNNNPPRYLTGYFKKEWYGLNFICGVYQAGYQYHKPGTNHGSWLKLWRLPKT